MVKRTHIQRGRKRRGIGNLTNDVNESPYPGALRIAGQGARQRKKNSGCRNVGVSIVQGYGRQHARGCGVLDDINGFLKSTKILSNVGNVLLPLAGGALGTFLAPGAGSAVGAALGASANEGIKSLGYGRKRTGSRKPIYGHRSDGNTGHTAFAKAGITGTSRKRGGNNFLNDTVSSFGRVAF